MYEAIIIICGHNTHYFNPEIDDFQLGVCACPHKLIDYVEGIKKERRYKGHIELCQINLTFQEFEEENF